MVSSTDWAVCQSRAYVLQQARELLCSAELHLECSGWFLPCNTYFKCNHVLFVQVDIPVSSLILGYVFVVVLHLFIILSSFWVSTTFATDPWLRPNHDLHFAETAQTCRGFSTFLRNVSQPSILLSWMSAMHFQVLPNVMLETYNYQR